MWGDTRDSRCVGVGFDELPDDLLAQGFACDAVSAIYGTEDVTFHHAGWRCPRINGHLCPGRHRRCDSQLPVRMPCVFALFTREMPAANSGASRPLSAASAASLRIADMRMMIDDEPRRRSSSDTLHALTVALGETRLRRLL